MKDTETIPVCGKCDSIAEKRDMIFSSFWYCATCKDEPAPKKKDLSLEEEFDKMLWEGNYVAPNPNWDDVNYFSITANPLGFITIPKKAIVVKILPPPDSL